MSRNVVGVLGTVIIAIYIIGSGRMVATDAEWYRSLPRPSWQPPSSVFGIIWPYNFAMLVTATWLVTSRLSTANQIIWLLSLALSVTAALTWAWLFYGPHAILASVSHSCVRQCLRSHVFPCSWVCFFALPTLVSSGYVACLWLRRVGDSWLVEMGTLSA
jgi:hypothetical protein